MFIKFFLFSFLTASDIFMMADPADSSGVTQPKPADSDSFTQSVNIDAYASSIKK